MITHTIDQFIFNPKSILLTSSYRIPSQNKVKAEKLEKFAKIWNFRILLSTLQATHPLMVVIICGKYGNNRSRTENITERTRFSKSKSNDLEYIGQGQRSSHVTHLLMLVIICTKYGKNPSRTVDVTERTWQAGQTDGHTDRRTDRRTEGRSETNIPPNNLVVRGYNLLFGGYKYLINWIEQREVIQCLSNELRDFCAHS